MEKMMNSYAKSKGTYVDTLRFLFDGKRVEKDATPQSLEMEEEKDDMIEVYSECLGEGKVTQANAKEVMPAPPSKQKPKKKEEMQDSCNSSAASSMADDNDYSEMMAEMEDSQQSNDSQKRSANDYQILSVDDIKAEMERVVNETAPIIGQPLIICYTLLQECNWSKEKLLEKFTDASDSDAFVRSMNISTSRPAMTTSECKKDCLVCWEKRPLTGLQCGHFLCFKCWNSYISGKVTNEGECSITCPAIDCKLRMNDETAHDLIKSKTVREAHTKLIINGFVTNMRLIKWCPGTDCGRAVKTQVIGCRAIKCTCGIIYCFECCEDWHEPVSCDLLKIWLKQCRSDSETHNWIQAYTKDCPKCKTAIEKNGGCNHMSCRSPSCRHEFCWICLADWKTHAQAYSCNRYNEDTKEKQGQAENARSTLKRYLHYYDRYDNHQRSLKLESKLYAEVDKRMEQLQKRNLTYVETQFMRRAVDVLGDCRRTLMYTYAFAFYLSQASNMTKLFEDNQQDLESATEQLSGFLEQDMIVEKDIMSLKQKVQDKASYVEQRRKILLVTCQEGTEKGQWEYNTAEFTIGTVTF